MLGTASFDDYFAEKVLADLEKDFNDPIMHDSYPPLEGSSFPIFFLFLFIFIYMYAYTYAYLRLVYNSFKNCLHLLIAVFLQKI